MFGKLTLAPMGSSHVKKALKIINQHDDEDAQWAEKTYNKSLANQFVYKKGRRVLGVTGYSEDRDTVWISWTYIDKSQQGQSYGRQMLTALLDLLTERGFRKAFVSTSDYRESPSKPMLYDKAISLYKKLGFSLEVQHPNYFDEGESELVFGLRFKSADYSDIEVLNIDDSAGFTLGTPFHINETEGCYAIDWKLEGSQMFTMDDFEIASNFLKSRSAHSLFISFPSSYLNRTLGVLRDSGFTEEGRLLDFHEDGVHEVRFRKTLKN